MRVVDLKLTTDLLDLLFPYEGEGQKVRSTKLSSALARGVLGLPMDAELKWHLPDVFSVRYGSSYVGTASCGDQKVRFHMYEGEFRQGDDL